MAIDLLFVMQNMDNCVKILNDPMYPGTWNDLVCDEVEAYLCEADLGEYRIGQFQCLNLFVCFIIFFIIDFNVDTTTLWNQNKK